MLTLDADGDVAQRRLAADDDARLELAFAAISPAAGAVTRAVAIRPTR